MNSQLRCVENKELAWTISLRAPQAEQRYKPIADKAVFIWRNKNPFFSRNPWFKTFLGLKNGIPSHEPLARVFARIKSAAFQERFVRWV